MSIFSELPNLLQTYVHRYRETDQQKDRETDRQADRKTDRQKGRRSHRQKEEQTHRHTDRKSEIQKDRPTDIQTTQAERERFINLLACRSLTLNFALSSCCIGRFGWSHTSKHSFRIHCYHKEVADGPYTF